MLERFGYPYSTLARIQRVKRAQALLTSGQTLGDAAAQAGYSDQPHLTREFKRLVGATPGQFLASSA
jgi:AraC-like DNA-binding protein